MLLVPEIRGEQEAPAIGRAAQREPAGFRVRAFARRPIRRSPDFHALVILAQDDVHHAADRVGAVNCRGAVGENLDTLHGRQRNDVEVHRLVGGDGRTRHAPPVQQHQGPVGADSVKIDGGLADPRTARTLPRRTQAVDRVVAEHVRHRFAAAQQNVLARDHHHRPRLLDVDPPDARPGDHLAPELHDVLAIFLGYGLRIIISALETKAEQYFGRILPFIGQQAALVRKYISLPIFACEILSFGQTVRAQYPGGAIIEFLNHHAGFADLQVHQLHQQRNFPFLRMLRCGPQPGVRLYQVLGNALSHVVHEAQNQLRHCNALLGGLEHPLRGRIHVPLHFAHAV